ncbi:uncharacterized protein B0T15DRAFT_402216 [Chaetomium strumarium]|uniref:Uncharacterized protein n=1 Tax=Chaetomium strumarium TaxID=1170767 RepID=A0AAJ0GNM8_9PEZI|nr:hypothetical protein B0T15DRAFT_402216 [Chaetomium strumarium]
MAVEGATQALVAAFFFGIVLNAASAALVLYLRGYGVAAACRDSQRLVLVLFLLSAALWAQIDFITILLDVTTSSMPCQIGVIFSSVFDQLARFSIEQFLLWVLNNSNGAKVSVLQLIAQILVLGRFVAGAVFVGFTRPQTDTFCVARTSALPVGILVSALDAAIILLLVVRAYSAGGAVTDTHRGKATNGDRARALMFVLLSLALWTGTSVPLLLGFRALALAIRTALPASGLLVVIISVAGGAGTLLTSRVVTAQPPEAPSPRRINISRDISTSDTDYPPTRFEDLKEAALRSSTTFVNPREAPRAKDPTTGIGWAMGIESGLPNGLKGEPMPPLPISAFSTAAPARKKSLFTSGKGKVTISHPILHENAPQHPLRKIAVVDLAEAAVAERERRNRMHHDEREAAGRPTRQWMSMSPEEGVKRAVSLKRKEVSSVSTRESVFPGALRPGDVAVASTTSAQLSPGGEETRRRSPRPSLPEETAQPRSVSPVQAPGSMRSRSESPPNRPLTLQQPLLKTDIRPSRMLPPSAKAPPPEPTKTPLQRRPTIGLPSNPRARGVQVAEESGSQHRTILFVNNIEYNDPAAVEAIIKGAGNGSTKPAPVAETPGTSDSVVHRPRPIPRRPSLVHRRTKSSGSLIGRGSLLRSTPGSPSQLPPLPPLPTRSATVSVRPHPNDTRSMTLEEKLTFFFPSPPSAKSIKRRSSVPEVPRIPASYLDVDSSPGELTHRQPSDRTTKTSVRTESILDVDEIRRQPARQASGKRASSPIIPDVPVRVSAWTETTYDRSEDDATNWSAMPSPELAVSVPVVHRPGLPASIQMPARKDTQASQLHVPQPTDNRTSSATVPFVLDTSTVPPSECEAAATPERSTWHRRVGDECPTFSVRTRKTRSRKMSPPPPLSLNAVTAKHTIAIQVEPSPLESPGQAIRQIRAQLRKFEELEQQSASPQSATRRLALLEDLEREMGQQAEHWREIKHDIGRDSLSSMQTTSRRESLISAAGSHVASESPRRPGIGAERRASRSIIPSSSTNGNLGIPDVSVRKSASPQLSNWQKRLTEAHMDYMDVQHLRSSNVNLLHLARAQLASPTPPDSDQSDQSDEEVPPVPSLPSKVATEWSRQAQPKRPSLWKPASTEPAASTSLLWAPGLKTGVKTEAPLPGLSVRPAKRTEEAPLRIESSLLWRKPYQAANRSTSGLWRPLWASAAPPAEPITRTPSKMTSSTSPSPKPPRPVTQRPPRRNKRVTLLPDILESPKPLPDRQGTLGIFQFPWGEKSDTASIQARPTMFMAMPGTMTSGGPSLGAAAFKPPEPASGYSSSFFDDYDDEEDDDPILDSDEEDGSDDDGFDETTLWEIASLLKTDSVPSLRSDSVLDDYAEDDSELSSNDDDDNGESPREQIVIGLAEPRELLLEQQQQRDSATIESSTLLMLGEALEARKSPSPSPSKPDARVVGLPANPKASLDAQVPRAEAEPSPMQDRSSGVEARSKQPSAGLWLPPWRADEPSSPTSGGLFVPGPNRSGYRGTSAEPAAKYIPRRPRPAQQSRLDRLSSRELWTPVNRSGESERNWIKQVLVSVSAGFTSTLRRRYQRPQASSGDWMAALHEAIAASKKTLRRVTASGPAEWESALQEAIRLSTRPSPALDPAVRHPVFFGSLAIAATTSSTDAVAVHPAMSAYAAKERPSHAQQADDSLRKESRALEEEGEEGQETSSHASSSNKTILPQSDHPSNAIQAQIEALEQERLFVERAAREEYRRRTTTALSTTATTTTTTTSSTTTPTAPDKTMMTTTTTTTMMMPAGAETVEDLQRRLSAQIRQSLVLAHNPFLSPSSASGSGSGSRGGVGVAVTSVSRSGVATSDVSKTESSSSSSSRSVKSTASGKGKPLLWAASPSRPVSGSSRPGLWTPTPTPRVVNHSSIAPSWQQQGNDAQPPCRRRAMQKGLDPDPVAVGGDFGGVGLWSVATMAGLHREGGSSRSGRGRDWLGSVCV